MSIWKLVSVALSVIALLTASIEYYGAVFFCPSCDRPLDDFSFAAFCPYCGQRLGEYWE